MLMVTVQNLPTLLVVSIYLSRSIRVFGKVHAK